MDRTGWTFLPGLLACTLLLTAPLFAQRPGQPAPGSPGSWRIIGTTHASHSADHDALMVKGPFDDFRKIKFKVTDAPLNMYHMVVTYENGQPDRIDVRQNISKGGESRVIDLKGRGTRRIRKIEYWYESKGLLNGTADVTVFGMK